MKYQGEKDFTNVNKSVTLGRAIKGSRFLLQSSVNNKKAELNQQILKSSSSLLSFAISDLKIQWISPLKEQDYQEYRNEFLEQIEEWVDKREILEKFWTRQGPQWDGIGLVKGEDAKNGLLLIEAKAHTQEMESKLQATNPNSKALIKKTIIEVMEAFESKAAMENWLYQYYQLANRLAYLYILNEKLKIPTWLILINYVNDRSHISTSLNEWLHHYNKVFNQMDIRPERSYLGNYIVSVFPE